MKKLNKKGFTIVELVIVIAVIAILAGVLIPTFAGIIDKAEQSNALQEAKNAYTDDLITADGQVENFADGSLTFKGTYADGVYTYAKDGEFSATYTVATGEWVVTLVD